MQVKIHVYEKLEDAEPFETVEVTGATDQEVNDKVLAWFQQHGDSAVICDIEIIHSSTAREFVFYGKP